MPVWRILLASVLFLAALPAAAADSESGPSMAVQLGVGGLTSPDRPTDLLVEIRSPVLISGRLLVEGGGVSVSRPVEVPAGGEQTYRLTIPPLSDGTRLMVAVIDGDDEPILSEAINARTPSTEEMAVGVMGDPDLVDLLGRVRTVITDRPVAAFAVPVESAPAHFDVVDYLIVTRGGADGVDAALQWARSGGRVVLDSSLEGAAAVSGPVAFGVEGVTRGTAGGGSVLIVEQLGSRSAEDWADILRPAPLDLSRSNVARPMGNTEPLLQAASEAGSRQVPSLPWLLFALVGFAALVGPVNFIVLSKLGKRDWAWMTVPAVALLAVGAFWAAGRQRIAGTNLTHASVISAQGTTEARSVVLVAAGTAGRRQIDFDPAATVYPERPIAGGSGPSLHLVDDDTVAVELEQLGFTGIGVLRSDPQVVLPSVSLDGDRLVVENQGDLHFWGWGVTSADTSVVAASELAPGGTGQVALPRRGGGQFGFGFVDALINQHQLWEDPGRNNSLWSLGQVLFSETDQGGIYFVGLTDDFRPQVRVDDASPDMPGPTLVVMEVAGASVAAESTGAVLVDTGFINWVDWGGTQQIVSADEITVRFRLPDPSVSPELADSRRFGGAPADYQAWDWSGGEFVEIDLGEQLDPGLVAPDGEVYVRLVGANEFGDNPMSPQDLSLEWEAQ